MIDASVLLKNKTDKHLNVFWQYDGKPWLENNITKALINTFESLETDSKQELIRVFFEIDLCGEVTYKYYLQKIPLLDTVCSKLMSIINDKQFTIIDMSSKRQYIRRDLYDCCTIGFA